MNSINLPSAAIPQLTGAASAQSGLPLDLAMLDSAVPEELFAALLAGQLQAVTSVTGESVDVDLAASTLASDELAQALVADVAAMLQTPQDTSALVAATIAQNPAMPVLAEVVVEGEQGLPALMAPILSDPLAQQSDAELNMSPEFDQAGDQRQAIAVSTAAFAVPQAAATVPVMTAPITPAAMQLPGNDGMTSSAPMMAAAPAPLPLSEAAVVTAPQPQGAMTFALPQMQQSVAPQALPLPQTAIPQQVGSQAWGGMVGERVVWMFGQQHQSAEIMLNPPSLGPLEVRLSMSDGQANLTFTTQHAPVREALEAATPRLREMLTESGIGLGTVSVNVGNFSRQDPQAQQQAAERQPSSWTEDPGIHDFSVLATDLPSRRGNGLLDLFA